jgi:hypothetical protein
MDSHCPSSSYQLNNLETIFFVSLFIYFKSRKATSLPHITIVRRDVQPVKLAAWCQNEQRLINLRFHNLHPC